MEQAPQKTVKHLVQAAAEEICRSLAVMPWNAMMKHIRIVVKEARKDQLDEYVGLLLAQMAAVRDVNITSKRKQDDPDMETESLYAASRPSVC
ncbi:hypothetical protein WJX75_005868 [Coccomyxa subellipsoidea]|uniref:Uncharacterized protein n=1 Tax=Coccomyxa subellipsoidea TaxID=248742 RepID=A0ABR2YL35_9CHLO